MRNFLLTSAALASATLAIGQTSGGILFREKTTGMLGLTAGHTVRLSAFYPRSLAPIAQALCSATLRISDSQGNILASLNPTLINGGQTVSLDVNHDISLTRNARADVHGISTALSGCNLVTSMELIDNASQKSILVVGSEVTFDATPKPSTSSGGSATIVSRDQP